MWHQYWDYKTYAVPSLLHSRDIHPGLWDAQHTLLFGMGWLWVSVCGEGGKAACVAQMPWRVLGCWWFLFHHSHVALPCSSSCQPQLSCKSKRWLTQQASTSHVFQNTKVAFGFFSFQCVRQGLGEHIQSEKLQIAKMNGKIGILIYTAIYLMQVGRWASTVTYMQFMANPAEWQQNLCQRLLLKRKKKMYVDLVFNSFYILNTGVFQE